MSEIHTVTREKYAAICTFPEGEHYPIYQVNLRCGCVLNYTFRKKNLLLPEIEVTSVKNLPFKIQCESCGNLRKQLEENRSEFKKLENLIHGKEWLERMVYVRSEESMLMVPAKISHGYISLCDSGESDMHDK
jgi:hypothetical protein